jgi:GNAT superfamily N-acetyltransferase
LEDCDEKFGSLERMRYEYVDHENMYGECRRLWEFKALGENLLICGLVVHLLGTDPTYQRKGLAKMLLKHRLDLADAESRKAYIQAPADRYPVYLKLGFREIAVLRIDRSKWDGRSQA